MNPFIDIDPRGSIGSIGSIGYTRRFCLLAPRDGRSETPRETRSCFWDESIRPRDAVAAAARSPPPRAGLRHLQTRRCGDQRSPGANLEPPRGHGGLLPHRGRAHPRRLPPQPHLGELLRAGRTTILPTRRFQANAPNSRQLRAANVRRQLQLQVRGGRDAPPAPNPPNFSA